MSSRTNIPKLQTAAAPSALIIQIKSAQKLSDLPSYLSNLQLIKQFQATCYHGWMTSTDLFDGFALESEYFLNIICDSFKKTFPDAKYMPHHKDIFHQTVSVVIALFATHQKAMLNRSTITSKHTGPTLPIIRLRKSQSIFLNYQQLRLRNGQPQLMLLVWVSWSMQSHAHLDIAWWREQQISRWGSRICSNYNNTE